ncbi:MAG: hypothetical protein BGN88_14315 [Clostridiales bacterium 43-6]|nr:MAG: hypothetical protein BGN88_14315 [Clostridiales bacterium 43-6]
MKGHESLSLGDTFLVALFCMALVFAILTLLFLCIRLFSYVLSLFTKKKAPVASPIVEQPSTVDIGDFSSGELKLYNVDERTAAMIMAIVSDESGIPLSELCFRSIKAVEKA